MRVPLAWLREFVDWSGGADELAQALTARGVAVEAVERPYAGAAGLLAAEIVEVAPHPTAAHLRVLRLQAGRAGGGSVVSGAPNLARGMVVPWAPPGSALPGGRALAVQEFGGVRSEGMACSADEIGLPGEHADGLLPLPPDLPPGADLIAGLELDDVVLVLELTPNYAVHCQSMLGVAREVAALSGTALRPPADPALPPLLPASAAVAVFVDAPDLCGRFVGLQVSGLAVRPAPLAVQRRLAAAGMRPVNALVDATNYVMLEVGQPLHAYDLRDLRGGRIGARRAGPGEVVVTLDGQRRPLTPADLVIADGERAVGVAGVMGGLDTEVHEDTAEVLVEAAYFQPEGVARTARRLGLASAAAARFGRGVDPARVRWAAERCAELMVAWSGCGGLGAEPVADVRTPALPERERVVRLRGALARRLLGVDVTAAECGQHLSALGFRVSADGADRLRVGVPSWRGDVAEEIDLVEEVGRAHGYDRIPEVLPGGAPGAPAPDPAGACAELAGAVARGAGYSEAATPSLHAAADWERLRLPAGHPLRAATAVANPMTEEQAVLRRLLLPGLAAALGHNARHRRTEAALYEAGRVYGAAAAGPDGPGSAAAGAEDGLPRAPGAPAERRHFALAAAGPAADFLGVKGVVEEILARLGLREVRWERAAPADLPFLHPGRSAWAVAADGARLGGVGEIHPQTAAAYGIGERAAAAELDLELVAARRPEVAAYRPWLRAPAVRRDLALVLGEEVPAAEVDRAIRRAAGELLADCRLFDVYTGEGIEAGRRSLAYTLIYQADRTLTDAEVDRCQEAVRAALASDLGAALRS